jgi:hypothetical protein
MNEREIEAMERRWKAQHERDVAYMVHDRARMRAAELEAAELRADKAMMAENEQRMQAAGDRLAAALEGARRELESGPVAIPAVENALDIIDAALASYRTP